MAKKIAQSKSYVLAEDKWLTKLEITHRKNIEAAIRELEETIINDFRSLKTLSGGKLATARENLASAQRIHTKLVAEVERTYGTAYRNVVKDFSKISAMVDKSFAALGEAGKFTDFNVQMLEQLKLSTYEQFAEYGAKVQDSVAKAMYSNIVAGAPMSKLEGTIRRLLRDEVDAKGNSMAAHAKQMASDTIRQYHQETTLVKAEVAGITSFLYYGNAMKTTRDFCLEHMGNVYTREEIDSWDDMDWDGKSGPAMTHRGGYNCRHMWRPVRPEWVTEEGGAEQLDVAEE